MEEYDVDVPIGDILRWLREDAARPTPYLRVEAAKRYRLETEFDRAAFGISDEEDLQLVVVSGLLEIRPRESAGWVLRIKAEDTIGICPIGGEESYEDDDDLALKAFEDDFILPEKGEVEITVAAENETAKARFDRWLAGMLDYSHPHRIAP